MKRTALLFLIVLMIAPFTYRAVSQEVLDGIYVKEHVPAKKPVPYYFIREADMMWTKRIWRMVELTEKINLPLYYPKEPMNDRYSLIDLILWGVENGEIIVYNPIDDEFKVPMTLEEIDEKLGAGVDTTYVYNPETEMQEMKVIEGTRKTDEVQKLLIKEEWFFDKQRSAMDVRIIGMCPVRVYYREDDLEQTDRLMKKVLWVYFPAVRPVFANHEVFNPFNDAERKTFDDIFFKRRFSSYVFQESNVHNNRPITTYKVGRDALLEARKIKQFMRYFEHDLWEF